jgi:hypothetical protein
MNGVGLVGPGQEFPLLSDGEIACYEHGHNLLARGVDLAPDSCGVPAPAVESPGATLLSPISSHVWLPAGIHHGLKIEQDRRVTTGSFIDAANWKWCWHITVSDWWTVDAMRSVLHDKAAEVHFVVGGRRGTDHIVVIQCLPLDQFGKGLIHLAGHAHTNLAKVIQVEICLTPAEVAGFKHYDALANLFYMANNRFANVPNTLARSFKNTTRFTERGYARVKGHHGHIHVCENDHVDPTRQFRGPRLVQRIKTAPNNL